MKSMYTSIRPGQVWLDTKGNRIQAHGGSIITVGETFYWYGENKEKTLPGSGIWHYGVRMYKSRDLYNWEDLGLVAPPVLDDKDSPLHPSAFMDRPHILYCAKTRKFVLWMKIMQGTGVQYQTIATADAVTGPYTIVNRFSPQLMPSGENRLTIV